METSKTFKDTHQHSLSMISNKKQKHGSETPLLFTVLIHTLRYSNEYAYQQDFPRPNRSSAHANCCSDITE